MSATRFFTEWREEEAQRGQRIRVFGLGTAESDAQIRAIGAGCREFSPKGMKIRGENAEIAIYTLTKWS